MVFGTMNTRKFNHGWTRMNTDFLETNYAVIGTDGPAGRPAWMGVPANEVESLSISRTACLSSAPDYASRL
jgi:hypothetical protein